MAKMLGVAMAFLLLAGCSPEVPVRPLSVAPKVAPAISDEEASQLQIPLTDTGDGRAVRRDNLRAIPRVAALPFAHYLNKMHLRIHPIFVDEYLKSLARLPIEDPLNNQSLMVRVEIQIADSGALERVMVVRSSGVGSFDAAALDTIRRAAPFDKPPDETRSLSGKVYLYWGFHRDENAACSAMNARPFVLAK